MEATKNSVSDALSRALVALRENRLGDAWARSCLALRPNHAPAMMIAGSAALASGDATGAKIWFRRASELSADEPKPLFQLVLAQIVSSDPEASATIAELARRFPAEASGWRD